MKRKLSVFLAVVLAITACAALMWTSGNADTIKVTITESGGYLWGVPENCTVGELFTLYYVRPYIVINANGEEMLNRELVGTGCKIRYEKEIGDYKELVVVVRGDVSGDGKINATDYLKIKTHIRGSDRLTNEFFHAADVNGDKYVSSVDYLNVKAYFFGNYDIYANAPIVPNESQASSIPPDSDTPWTSGWH